MTKWDKMIIVSLLVISFLPHVLLGIGHIKQYDQLYAEVSVAGKIVQSIPLTGQSIPKTYSIETHYGTNVLVVDNQGIAVYEANCPDQVCMHTGFIDHPNESIVCLPNKLYIQVKGTTQEVPEIDVIAQ